MIGCIVSGMRKGRKFHISKNYCVNIKICAIFSSYATIQIYRFSEKKS